MAMLENFLRDRAHEISPNIFDGDYPDRVNYAENINPDAINGEAWLENETSYIWKVGVLMATDSNKCDWVNVFIGHQRGEGEAFEFIGHLFWRDGENDDIGRSLSRYLQCMRSSDSLFDND